jgi:hypothetical protein
MLQECCHFITLLIGFEYVDQALLKGIGVVGSDLLRQQVLGKAVNQKLWKQ